MKAATLDATQNLGAIFGLDEPDLEIISSRYLDITSRQIAGDGGEFPKLVGFHDTTRNPQSRHITVLHRRQPEEPVPFESKNVFWIGSGIPSCFEDEFFGSVERIQFAFDALLLCQVV